MEDFRKKLTQKCRLITGFCCFALPVYIGLMRFVKNADDFTVGLVTGMFIGIMLVSVFNVIKIQTALNNEKNFVRCTYSRPTKEI